MQDNTFNPRVVAILQARMGSTRLPGKVLANILGDSMLALIVKRINPTKSIDQLVIATTRSSMDNQIENVANNLGVPCFRGAEEDCLDRYFEAAKQFKAEVVVRLTGDNPLIDYNFIDYAIEQYFSSNPHYDYVDTSLSRTFPLGLSVEVFSFNALKAAWEEDANISWREHVTPYIYRNPNHFSVKHLISLKDYSHLRLTVDTLDDLTFVRRIFGHFGNIYFPWQEAISILEEHPEWLEINRHVRQKTI